MRQVRIVRLVALVAVALLLALAAELVISWVEKRITRPLVAHSVQDYVSGMKGVELMPGQGFTMMSPVSEIRLDPGGRYVDLLTFRVSSSGASKLSVYVTAEHTGAERRLAGNSGLSGSQDPRLEHAQMKVGERVRSLRIVSERAGTQLEELAFAEGGPVREARLATLSAAALLLLSALVAGSAYPRGVEVSVLLSVLSLGGLIVVTAPYAHIGWDEHVHYQRVDALIDTLGPGRGQFDAFASSYSPIWSRSFVEQRQINERHSRMSRADEKPTGPPLALPIGSGPTAKFFAGYVQLAYLPNAIGVQLARLLDVSIHTGFKMGRLTGLLCYALLASLAVRIAPFGKWVLASMASMPLGVFVASTHTYDAWMVGWLLLGSACLVRVTLSAEREYVASWLMLVAFFLGVAPKPIYFPLLLVPLVVVLRRDIDSSFRRRFGAVGTLLTAFAIASFALPILLDGAGNGDPRGGSGVNPGGQMAYILTHPLDFANTLVPAIASYLSLDRLPLLVNAYGVFGTGIGSGVIAMILVVLTYTEPRFSLPWQDRLPILGAVVASLVLIMVALYIAFNPVGATAIDGLQTRYLLVLVPLVIIALAWNRSDSAVLQGRIRGVLMAIVPAIGVWNWWEAIASSLY